MENEQEPQEELSKGKPRLADLLNISDLFEDVTETWLTRWLPAKPTLLYMYDVIARSQTLVQPKRWWVLIPSGYWRVAWGYIILGVSSADVFRCGLSLAFCQAPYVSFDLYVLQTVFLIDMILKFISAYPRGGGLLEIRADKIALNYLKTQFIVDITALAPLELWLTPCWPDNTADPTPFRTSFFALPTYVTARTDYSSDAATECYAQPNIRFLQFFSWQWLHLIRWFFNWSKCNGWRSITSTENDGIFEVIKYMALMVMVGHVACCLNFWASFNSTGLLAPICSYRDLGTLPWDYVSRVLRKHNALDPFSQLLVDESESLVAGSPRALLQPGGRAEAKQFSIQANWELYTYWYYVSFAMMLGDAFGAKVRRATRGRGEVPSNSPRPHECSAPRPLATHDLGHPFPPPLHTTHPRIVFPHEYL